MKKNYTYHFKSYLDDDEEKKNTISYLFQVCSFKNENDGYWIRKLLFNDENKFIEIKNYNLNKKQLKNLINNIPKHKIKYYSTPSLKHIPYPNEGELMICSSMMLR